jgi:hypothetical protein
MTRKQEEIISLTIIGVLILVCYFVAIYVIHTEIKKQPVKQKTFIFKQPSDWNLTELENGKRLYFENLTN